MKDIEDAFGQMLRHRLRGGTCREIAERDDGYIEASGGPDSYFAAFRDWPAYERRAMRYVRGRVLDVGCGAGRHCLHLQEQGFDVTGIDSSPLAVEVCRERGVRRCEEMTFARALASCRKLGGPFDTVLMMCNNLGLLETPARAKSRLRRLRRITNPGARIIGSTLDPYGTDRPEHRAYHRRNRSAGRLGGEVRIRIRHGQYATPWFRYLMMSRRELVRVISGTGWSLRATCDAPDNRYIAVLQRSE